MSGGAATAEEALVYYQEDAFGKLLFGNADCEKQVAAADALLTELRNYEAADGMRLGAAAWIVSATTP